MKFIASHGGKIIELKPRQQAENAVEDRVRTGLSEMDYLFGGGLVRGAVHELLNPAGVSKPVFPALFLAKAVMGISQRPRELGLNLVPSCPQMDEGVVVISDPQRKLYPPAVAQLGLPLWRVYLLHSTDRQQELWAISECLASAGVSAVVAELGSLTQVEARRMQLAAERGRSMGIFIRPAGKRSEIYAAATRTLIRPAGGGKVTGACQGWHFELLHGRGCPVGMHLLLEYNREEHTVHSSSELADHKSSTQVQIARRAIA